MASFMDTMSIQQLGERPSAPFSPPDEKLENDDQIITLQNHPVSKFNSHVAFNPSFIGKTWGEMKEREENRETSFFKSQDLDKNLKTLYNSLIQPYSGYYECYDSCLLAWRSTPNLTLNLTSVSDLTETTRLPSDVRSVILNNYIHQATLAQNNTLLAIKIQSNILPVMPHVQVLDWIPQKDCIYDFSGWTSLRILVIRLFSERDCPKIKLPVGLISFSYLKYYRTPHKETFTDVFENIDHNTTVFQSLKHLNLKGTTWPSLPILSNCISLHLEQCGYLKIVEAPKCQVLSVDSCSESFEGFGSTSNYHLNKVVLFQEYNCDSTTRSKNVFRFPPGSPFGYKHIYLFRYPVSSLPNNFDPLAYISVFNSDDYLFIKSKQARDNLEFYFDHYAILYMSSEESKKYICKPNESLHDMIERMYGFNWPKFITKVQRQYRFNKFMKHEHKELISILPESISKYDIGKLLGATQTFKSFIKPKDNE